MAQGSLQVCAMRLYTTSTPLHECVIAMRPNWKNLSIHESSPDGATYHKMKMECPGYSFSYFFPDTPRGAIAPCGRRCENLEQMTFPSESFDVFITEDVFEHIFHPSTAFKEIARVLKSGGIHIFTVPIYKNLKTKQLAKLDEHEKIEHIETPEYHGNPISQDGALVVWHWGFDIVQTIYESSSMITTIFMTNDDKMGIEAEFLEVLVSYKP